MRFERPRPISVGDDLAGFDCAEPSLNDWLQRRALRSHLEGGARVFVTTSAGSHEVAGYYCVAPASVAHHQVSGRVRRNMPDPIPVLLIGRLAVDRRAKGHGLGADLLRDAVTRCVRAADEIGGRAIVVHALNADAGAFYARYGFVPSPTDQLHMILLVKDARAAWEAS